MKTSTISWIVVILIIVLGVWYFMSGKSTQPYAASAPAAVTQPEANTPQTGAGVNNPPGTVTNVTPVLKVSSSAALGSFLVASNGMTLYTYKKDTTNVSNCTGGCATSWPPYTVTADQAISVDASVKGVLTNLTRADGTLQLTYNGHPLYFWQGDKKAGDTLGQGVGGVWFVAKP